MSCRILQENDLIPKYLNGQLGPVAVDQVELHILECQSCREAVDLLLTVRDEVEAQAHEIRAYSAPRVRFRWSWVAVAALAVIVSGIGVQKFTRSKRAASRTTSAARGPADLRGTQDWHTASAATPPTTEMGTASKGSPDGSKRPSTGLAASRSPSKPPQTVVTHAKTIDETIVAGIPKVADKNSAAGTSSDDATKAASPSGLVETSHTSTTDTIGQRRVDNLPINGRNYINFTLTDMLGVTQLATVRPLPYTFSGMAGSQPSKGGSTKGSRTPTSTVAGNAGTNPQPGTGGFTTPEGSFQDGMTAYVERRYDTAADLLSEAVRLDPEFTDANLYLGICRLLQGKAADAIPPLQSASKGKKPAAVQAAHFYMGKTYLQLGKLAEAEAEFQAAAAIPGRLTGEAAAIVPRLQAIRRAAEVTPDRNK
jgi:Tetratricopeptide repeat/Putative zinc-finger